MLRELSIEKDIIQNKEVPLTRYNYSYIKDRLTEKYHQKVPLATLLLNQQLHSTSIHDRPTVSVSLADRDLLQMDQAAPSYQSLLCHHRVVTIKRISSLPRPARWRARVKDSLADASLTIPSSTMEWKRIFRLSAMITVFAVTEPMLILAITPISIFEPIQY